MAQSNTSTNGVPPHVAAFNQKVAELVKSTSATDMADVLSHPGSLLKSAAMDNINQNGRAARGAE